MVVDAHSFRFIEAPDRYLNAVIQDLLVHRERASAP